jgi:hypothetical protein
VHTSKQGKRNLVDKINDPAGVSNPISTVRLISKNFAYYLACLVDYLACQS